MRMVPVGQFKANVSAFVTAAEGGEEIIITRRGKPVARLVPVAATRDDCEPAFDAGWDRLMVRLAQMRVEGRTTTNAELIAWKNEGRR